MEQGGWCGGGGGVGSNPQGDQANRPALNMILSSWFLAKKLSSKHFFHL